MVYIKKKILINFSSVCCQSNTVTKAAESLTYRRYLINTVLTLHCHYCYHWVSFYPIQRIIYENNLFPLNVKNFSVAF